MKPVEAWRQERDVWRSLWRQVETFVDRIQDLRDQCQANVELVQAVLPVMQAIHEERRWRNGEGLDVPLETSLTRGETIDADLTDDDFFSNRLPGLLEIEGAVAALTMTPSDPSKGFQIDDLKNISNIRLPPTQSIFKIHTDEGWSSFEVPAYPGAALSGAGPFTSAQSFFPKKDRESAAMSQGEKYPRQTFSSLVSSRDWPEPSDGDDGWRSLLDSAASREQRMRAAQSAQGACQRGKSAIAKCTAYLSEEGTDVDGLLDLLARASAEFERRRSIYAHIAANGDIGDESVLLQHPWEIDNIELLLRPLLDEAIEALISYPDGPLRMLRALEGAFATHWVFRKIWFDARRNRYATPRLLRVLQPFRQSLAALREDKPTPYAHPAALGRPAASGDTILYLVQSPFAGKPPFSKLEPGHVAVVEGSRRTLALVLGDAGPSLPDEKGTRLDRLHVAPLFVSMAQGPGVMGLVDAGALGAGPLALSKGALRHATESAHPEHDGALQAMVSLWSKLCLLLGHDEVTGSHELPSPLPLGTKLPVEGTVQPGAQQLVLDVKAVVGLGIDAKNPAFARVGEMLLVQGKDASGELWQGACEVMALQRVPAADTRKTIAVLPPKPPVCCDCNGDKLVLLVRDYLVPEPLTEVVVHRHFKGFGAPSLAAGQLLPNVVDPRTSDAKDEPYRGPELATACRVLEQWLTKA